MSDKGEFELIREFFTRPPLDNSLRLGIGDDAAVIAVPEDHELVVTTDTLVAGRHFPESAKPFDIGWKALAVNLSDLAAMGAQARWVTLALTLPASDENFLREFSRGFFALADQEKVGLIGGDTTRGPLTITVTAMGMVPQGQALKRSGAKAGDDLYVSGTPGDAGLGLRLVLDQCQDNLSETARDFALARLHRPQPRLALGERLRGVASACMDISDGLAQDLGHLLRASVLGAELHLELLPRSAALAGIDTAFADILALTSGDDYELLFTAPVSMRERLATMPAPCTRIGRMTTAPDLVFLRDDQPVAMPQNGYLHF